MSNLFAVLLLGAIVGIFYFRKKDKKKRNIAIGVAIISFIFFGLTSPEVEDGYEASKESETQESSTSESVEESSKPVESEESSKESESESESSESVESESSKPEFSTIEEAIEWSGNDVFGDNLREVSYDPETGYIQLDADIEIGGWSVASSRKEFDKLVVKFMEDIQDEDFTQLNINGYAKMQDTYGNSEDSDVVRYPISKENVDKIDFENFNVDNLEEVAEGAFIHPEFR